MGFSGTGGVRAAVEEAFAQQKEDGTVLSTASNEEAITALKADGTVVTWGDTYSGGDCSTVQKQLASGVQSIYATERAFAVLKIDGSMGP